MLVVNYGKLVLGAPLLTKGYLCLSTSELTHWPTQRGHIVTLEATAYALLALVKAKVRTSLHHHCNNTDLTKTGMLFLGLFVNM